MLNGEEMSRQHFTCMQEKPSLEDSQMMKKLLVLRGQQSYVGSKKAKAKKSQQKLQRIEKWRLIEKPPEDLEEAAQAEDKEAEILYYFIVLKVGRYGGDSRL